MKIKHNNHIYAIESQIQGNELTASINNNAVNYQFEKVDDYLSYIWIDGIKHKAYCAKDKKDVFIWIDGHSFKFDFVDDDKEESIDNENTNRQEVIAPMPGNIVKIMVEENQEIAEATPLLIVEAMKMETTLYSQISGYIKEINCNEKEQVDCDKILIVIEKKE